MASDRLTNWKGPEGEIGAAVDEISQQTLNAYREAPRLVLEHANLERSAIEGGYGRRQLYELIQNGADELVGSSGRVEVVVTPEALYCANEGRPLSTQGVGALLFAHLSAKSGVEIGRFGLGFKSVLGITKKPEIFSRTGSLRFDPEHARRAIADAIGKGVDRAPTLRIGVPLDPATAAEEDGLLADLMTWASTVVRLSRDVEDSSWLERDIRSFPSEFLLFTPHVAELVLSDMEEDVRQTITVRQEADDLRVLKEEGRESHWRVFSAVHEPSESARRDAGAMAERDEVPISWAVETRRGRRGQFWAFFPTLDQTTLSGVVNAPWKLNEDRTRVIDGPFNKELIEVVALLVIENMEQLVSEEDPGLVLDLMPARGREAAGWADEELTKTVNDMAAYNPSIPDQEGELELPTNLTLHPPDIPRPILDVWSASPSRPKSWCHPSVETRDRRARVDVYMHRVGGRVANLHEWLQALTRSKTVEGSASAIAAAGRLLVERPDLEDELREIPVILTEEKEVVPPEPGNIFVRAPLPVEVETVYVHPELLERPDARDGLALLGIREVDPYQLLESYVKEYSRAWKPPEWDRFWDLARRSPRERVAGLIESYDLTAGDVYVRTKAGRYAPLIAVLLPGEIVPDNSSEDAESTVDTGFHADELPLLRLLGAVAGPTSGAGRQDEPWFEEYYEFVLKEYLGRLRASGAAPNSEYLEFRGRPLPGPAQPLASGMSLRGRARFTEALLGAASDLKDWTFCHRSQSRYPERSYPNPIVWLVNRNGLFATSLGIAPPAQSVAPHLGAYRDLLPVALEVPGTAAEALRLPMDLSELGEEHWSVFMKATQKLDSPSLLAKAYVGAAAHGVKAPAVIRCQVGHTLDEREPETVVVTADDEHAHLFVKTSQPFLQLARHEDMDVLVSTWGLRLGDEAIRSEVGHVPAGEGEPLGDLFPMLKLLLDNAQRGLEVIPCLELRLESHTEGGLNSADKDLVVHKGRIYRHVELGDQEFLQQISRHLGLDLDDARITAIVKNLDDQRIRKLRSKIRQEKDPQQKLLLAIGSDALRSRIPSPVLEAATRLQGELGDIDIAGLALAVHGVEVLQKHAEDLEHRDLGPPLQWAGRRKALEFVRDLGFAPGYAGFEKATLDRVAEVEGPPDIPPLHAFQSIVVGEIRDLVLGENGRRGLLSLPTGAGKTRVTIEGIIDAMRADQLKSPILWVAQTEELCEQSVQAWSELWRGVGPRRRLTISRLWGSFSAEEAEYGEQVVVATIQKLSAGSVYDNAGYDWLKAKATCIVVDEAHRSVGPIYTDLLRWQEMARGRDRAPLIGLTATPFRGTNVEETERLVSRYGGRRLDLNALGGADAYPHLQELGILSHVDHDLLPGSELSLSTSELDHLKQTRQLPPSASHALAADVDRNETLLESLTKVDSDWPVLLFAVSVEHAQMMAALLNRDGIPSAAITGEMDRGARRYYVEAFRRGELRVLTNFNVLTAGFDAPKVKAVYVARPTYSPNMYQQMVGRGLRGPKNGGTERCLLVNVADNVAQYGERLAFHEFDYLWNEASPGPDQAI